MRMAIFLAMGDVGDRGRIWHFETQWQQRLICFLQVHTAVRTDEPLTHTSGFIIIAPSSRVGFTVPASSPCVTLS